MKELATSTATERCDATVYTAHTVITRRREDADTSGRRERGAPTKFARRSNDHHGSTSAARYRT